MPFSQAVSVLKSKNKIAKAEIDRHYVYWPVESICLQRSLALLVVSLEILHTGCFRPRRRLSSTWTYKISVLA